MHSTNCLSNEWAKIPLTGLATLQFDQRKCQLIKPIVVDYKLELRVPRQLLIYKRVMLPQSVYSTFHDWTKSERRTSDDL